MHSLTTVFGLARRSLQNRAATALLTIFSIAISVALLVGVERVRTEARTSFTNTISGTDLIVGARSGDINLLLYSVFRIGNATNNISWESYEEIAANPLVEWTVPISLGDSHRGFRVMGTNDGYFKHYRFAGSRTLEFSEGKPFGNVFETVLGSDVAAQLGYNIGDEIVIAHGTGATSFANHDDKPFTVTGILKKTGTPLDRTVHVSLAGIEAMHIDWQSGAQIPGQSKSAEQAMQADLTPEAITAFMVGLKSRAATFKVQRQINEYTEEPLLAIIPGVTLQQLWELVRMAEVALLAVSICVVVAGLIGMLTSILVSLNERRREMAILRAVGARPWHVVLLLISESALLAGAGALLGIGMIITATAALAPALESSFGIFIEVRWPGAFEWLIALVVVSAAVIVCLWPALRAYSNALADGLTIKI